MEVDRVGHLGLGRVDEMDPHGVADVGADGGSGELTVEGPDELLVALGDVISFSSMTISTSIRSPPSTPPPSVSVTP